MEGYGVIRKNQNLLKRDTFKIFSNVTDLTIHCKDYPLPMESLLSLIKETGINKVRISGEDWLSLFKEGSLFDDMESRYQEASLDIEFGAELDKITDVCITSREDFVLQFDLNHQLATCR